MCIFSGLMRSYIWESLLRLNISAKMQSESGLGNVEINVGGDVDSEADFLNDSKKM